MVGKVVSHYRILEKLGEGGMGVVYKAEDTRLKRIVAMKFLPPELSRDPEAKKRFIHEAQAASSLQHQNICAVHDIDETTDGALFMVMDLYEGETLKEKIDRGSLQVSEALDLALQISEGLSEAHRAGIVHRDVKPANIFVTRAGVVKILDFGLAKLSGRTLLTRTGSTIGTAAYMSPEQASGEPVDQRTDMWSFGVVLYEMVSGQRPFAADYENALIYSVLNVDPKPLAELRPGIPPGVGQVVARCLSKDPKGRYRDVDELITDLRACANGALPTGTMRNAYRRSGSTRRRRSRYVAIALSALMLAVVGYFILLPPSEFEKPLSHLKMIAVLPFENLGPAEDEYFADGLTEEITSRLTVISGLGVISRQSSIQYKKSPKTLPVIASELGVDYVIAATIRWVRSDGGQRIRITPHLLRVSGDRQLWSESMDVTLDDVFRVQTEIATQVIRALGIILKEEEMGSLEAIPTTNLDAYQAFLRGISPIDYEKTSADLSIEMFERAVDLDSNFALAYVALAQAHLNYHWAGFDRTGERLATARRTLDRAFALQPNLLEAHGLLALYYYRGLRDYDSALRELEAIRARAPNDSRALSLLAYIWRRQGKLEESVEELKKAATLDPMEAGRVREIGNTYYQMGRYEEAEKYLDRSISMLPDGRLAYIIKAEMYLRWNGDTGKSRSVLAQVPSPNPPREELVQLDIFERNYAAALAHLGQLPERMIVNQHAVTPVAQLYGLVYRLMGDSARARAWFDTARVLLASEIAKSPGDERLHTSLAIVYAGLGRGAEALREAERSLELMPFSRDAISGVYPHIAVAHVHALLGNADAAIRKLEYLLSLPAPKYITAPLLRIDPIYDPLRNNPRFQVLLTKTEQM